MSCVEQMTAGEARARVGFDPTTGRLMVLKHRRCPSLNGRETHCLDVHGYVQVNLKPYGPVKGHRLVWLLHYGQWPQGPIDHINGVKDDNRVENLRVVTHAQNSQNKLRPQTNCISGIRGVSYDRGAWRAKIQLAGRQIHLGRFKSQADAAEAYQIAKMELHPFAPLTTSPPFDPSFGQS